MQGSADLRIAEQLAIPVIVFSGNNLRKTSCFCHILCTSLRIPNKEIVVLVCVGLDQTEIRVHIIDTACHLDHKRTKYLTDALDLIRHCFISLKNCLGSRRITDQIDRILLYIRQAVCVLCNTFCLDAAVYRRVGFTATLQIR